MQRGQRLAVAALLLMAAKVHAAPAPAATVLAATGSLTVQRRGAPAPAQLAVRNALYVGDIVVTGANAKASLLFRDGSHVELNANSASQITAPAAAGRGNRDLLRVLSGEIWARLRPGVAVRTRSAIAGVRGTEINVRVSEDGTTTLTVIEGEVEFYNEFGAVVVPASQQSVARVGAAPTPPATVANTGLIIEWTLELDRAIIPREKFFVTPDRDAVPRELERRTERARSAPADAGARRDLGDILFDHREFGAALQEWQEADRLVPGVSATRARLGYALLELDRLEEAERVFRATVEANPQSALAATGLAWLELARDRPAAAEADAARAVALEPQGSEGRLVLGLALMRQPGGGPEAAQSFRAAQAAEPGAYGSQARAWLALVLLAQNDVEGALREAQAAATTAPKSGVARGNLALVYFFAGKPRDAEREARLAAVLSPDSVAARVALGEALLAQGDVEAAVRTAAQAVALDPKLPQAYYLLGVAETQRRDYRHAARALEAALRLAPDFLPAAAALARVYTRMGRNGEAIRLLTEVRSRYPEADAVLAALGEVYYEQGNYGEAIAQYRRALEMRPGSALYHAGLARTLLDANRLSAAIGAAMDAVRLAPQVGQYHAVLGLAYRFSGLNKQAEREFRTALALDPRNSLALARLAFSFSGADLRTAHSSLTQALIYDPAIPEQLLRGGIDVEVTPNGGDERRRGISVNHTDRAADGRLHFIGRLRSSREDGDARNEDIRVTDLVHATTYTPNPRTNLYFHAVGGRSKRGLFGPEAERDNDDRNAFRYNELELAVRQQIGPAAYLWAALNGGTTHDVVTNPTLNSAFLTVPGAPAQVPIERLTYKGPPDLTPDLRLDLILNRKSERPSVLTIGVGGSVGDNDIQLDLRNPGFPQTPIGNVLFHDEARILTAYTEYTQRLSDRFSFIAQVRAQQFRSREIVSTTVPGFGPEISRTLENRSFLLPSLVVSFQADRRTALRLSASRRWADPLQPSTLAPTVSLLTTELNSQPGGPLADRSNLTEDFEFTQAPAFPTTMGLIQLDFERYLPHNGFVKLFLFHTQARDVFLGGADLTGAGGGLPAASPPQLALSRWRGFGGGLRYEQAITPHLFGSLGFYLRRTSNDTPGFPFDGGSAPYEPRTLVTAALDYVDGKGNKLGLRLRRVGSFFADTDDPAATTRPRFPAGTYVDLRLAKEPSVHWEFFLVVTNLFDRREILFRGFPRDGRRVLAGITHRF